MKSHRITIRKHEPLALKIVAWAMILATGAWFGYLLFLTGGQY